MKATRSEWKVRVHFNKQHGRNPHSEGMPWTIHYRGKRIPAAHVVFKVPVHTVFRPNRTKDPRAWLQAFGVLEQRANGVVFINPGSP